MFVSIIIIYSILSLGDHQSKVPMIHEHAYMDVTANLSLAHGQWSRTRETERDSEGADKTLEPRWVATIEFAACNRHPT